MFLDPADVERKLAGRTMLFSLGDAARTVGLAPAYITTADWRRLASLLAALGWRERRVDGEKIWLRIADRSQQAALPL